MNELLANLGPFSSLGDFLATLFYNHAHGETDPRGLTHAKAVARFLRGSTEIRMSHILPLIYKHRHSYPSVSSSRPEEQKKMFCTQGPLDDIHHARPFLSTWAARLTAVESRKQVGHGTRDDPDDPDDHVQLRATTNGRGKGQVINRSHMARFSLVRLQQKYKKRQSLPMFLTEYMAAPRVNGVFVVRARRPHPLVKKKLHL